MEREGYDGSTDAGVDEEAGALREGAPVSRFDPTPYLRQLRGRGASGEYLDVKWRLLWLRTEHPDARIETEHIRIEPAMAIFKATVVLPTGGMATGYGSETPGDFGDYIEKAETKAIGRALNALGYGAQFIEPGDEEPGGPARPQDASRGVPPRQAIPTQRQAAAARASRGEGEASAPPPVELNANRERSASRPVEERVERAPTSAAAEQADDAGFSWAAFREWVRGQGLNSRDEINQLLGRDTAGMNPTELRDAIIAARS